MSEKTTGEDMLFEHDPRRRASNDGQTRQKAAIPQ